MADVHIFDLFGGNVFADAPGKPPTESVRKTRPKSKRAPRTKRADLSHASPEGVGGVNYALLTPTVDSDAIELSQGRFRKKILPIGTINYKGRRIDFDRAYLANLAQSYRENAYDQVPFMLADRDNSHTLAPERFGGEVTDIEVADDGLYAVLDLAPEAAELVRKNPKLGVSASLRSQDDRADGRRMGMAMQHVLGTLDPRVTGLGPWEEIALSRHDPTEQVIDLTHATYTEGGPTVADNPTDTQTAQAPDRGRFLRWLRGDKAPTGEQTDDGETEFTDEELAQLIAESAADDQAPEQQLVGAGAELSNSAAPTAVDLAARADLDVQRTQLAQMRATLATERFETERGEYARKGVPPALINLARPLLESADPVTVDLSNGVDTTTVDAGAIARQMLESMAGYIDLARERGHAFEPEPSEDAAAEDAATDEAVVAYKKSFGI